jgi:hypothetical protein
MIGIGEILFAVLKECKALLSGSGAEIILKTNLKKLDREAYSGNFILIDWTDAVDSLQYPNGLTRMDWKIGFNAYNIQPDAYVDDPTDYSTALLNFIDQVRQHFESGLVNDWWLTQGMTDIWNQYGFQFTFGGVGVAEAVELNGLLMGWRIEMETTALDSVTRSIVESTGVLEHVIGEVDENDVEVDRVINDPFIIIDDMSQNTNQVLPANIFVDSINMISNSGNPIVSVGSTLGGSDLIASQPIDGFERFKTEEYFENQTTLFFQISGGSVRVNIVATENFL